MLLLVGLGNPGGGYEDNRHNIGFMAVDEVVRRHSFTPFRARFQGLVSQGMVDGAKVMVLKPQTYMNESGRSVGEAVRFFKLAPEDVIVVHDDLDLTPGKVKIKTGGGHGGHNGLRSIDAHLGREYQRIRLGIGHPGHKDLVTRYVLKGFAKSDRVWLEKVMDAVGRSFALLAKGDAPGFMNRVALDLAPPRPKKPKPQDTTPKDEMNGKEDGI